VGSKWAKGASRAWWQRRGTGREALGVALDVAQGVRVSLMIGECVTQGVRVWR